MERQLIQYLPYAVWEFDVFKALTAGEQPEFELAWDAQELALANQYIDTATNYGLSRWEAMLQIVPRTSDTLESRRIKIKAKLNTIVPYTIRALIEKITAIAEGDPFTVTIAEASYVLQIITEWESNGQVDSLKDILELMVPVNIAIDSQHRIMGEIENPAYLANIPVITEMIALSDVGNDRYIFTETAKLPTVPAITQTFSLSD